jgi:hypothetical protein
MGFQIKLFFVSNFMLNSGPMQDLPFRNPFWHSKRNFSACTFNSSFKIQYILYNMHEIANSFIVSLLLFVTFLVYRYDYCFYILPAYRPSYKCYFKRTSVPSYEMSLLLTCTVQNSIYLHPVIFHFWFLILVLLSILPLL